MVKKIEMIGIEIKDLDQEIETRRFKLKTKLMNEHFLNELDKIRSTIDANSLHYILPILALSA